MKIIFFLVFLLLFTPVAMADRSEDWSCGDSDDPDCLLDWVEKVDDWDISSNEVVSVSGGGGVPILTLSTDAIDADIDVSVQVWTTNNGLAGVYVRGALPDASCYTGYFASIEPGLSGNVFIKETSWNDPSCDTTTVCSGGYFTGAGAEVTLRLVASGTSLEIFIAGGSICSSTDATWSSAGFTGLFGETTFDDYSFSEDPAGPRVMYQSRLKGD